MKKITVLALHLGYGGVEKSITSLVNALSKEYQIEIISVYKLYDEPVFKLNDNIKVEYLIEKYKPNREEWQKAFRSLNPIKFIKESYKSVITLHLRKSTMIEAIKKCDSDIIISTRHLFNKWVGEYAKKKTIKIGWEHNHPHGNDVYAKKVANSSKRLDYLVSVSDNIRKFYKHYLKDVKCKSVYIPNILDNYPKEVSSLEEKRIISIGRLAPEKGFVDLIEVFKVVSEKRSDWHLDIIGDGAQKNLICDKIFQYQLNDKVTVHGFRKKDYINNLLSKSSIYVMTSFTESFGIVLLEAMSHKLPCVSFSSAEGANDLIKKNESGYLIENRNISDMANKIIELIDDIELRKKQGEKGLEISKMFSSDIIKKEWIKIFKKS